MTLQPNQIVTEAHIRQATTPEAPLQAYIRQLHTTNNRFNTGDEPVRGKDPWIGLLS